MLTKYRTARVLPLAALILTVLGSCQDASQLTAPLTKRLSFTQVATAPVVNSLADPGTGGCDDTECTLREAIAFASGGATITFAPGLTGTVTLASGELVLNKNLTIAGPDGGTITISGNNASRVFYVAPSKVVTMSNLTITGGNGAGTSAVNVYPGVAGWGGGVLVDGASLTVRNSTFSGNNSGSYRGGGGIARLYGTLTVENSTISGNSGSYYGGGIYSYGSGPTIIKNSTISGNSVRDGMGDGGGGVMNYGIVYILYSTITGNSAGGVRTYNNTGLTKASEDTRMKGSIIAGNSNGDLNLTYTGSTYPVLYTGLGYNLIGSTGSWDTTGVFLESDQIGVASPGLAALADNGGPTRTHALQAGSPALDFIPAISCTDNAGTAVTVDQRGISRPQGSSCDIGAYELEVSSGTTPTFTFDLSTLPAKTFGDGTFSVAAGGYVNTNSTGAITFATGAGSVGCSVTSGGTVTITGAAVNPSACILEASLAADVTYTSAGPVQQSFNIAKAAGSVTISNVPASGAVGGNFTPTYTKAGDGTASSVSNSTGVCTVTDGVVNYIAAGTCLLQASVTAGTNHLAATGSEQSFTISAVVPTFAFDLSGLSKTYGDGTFSVASYATTNSTGAITFALGAGSVGCSVTSAGMVTISGAAADPNHCILAATLAAGGSYAGAGPIEQSFNIAKATGSVTISNLPASGTVGGNFTPTYTKAGDGIASTVSNSPSVCTVTGGLASFIAPVGGVVNFIATGTCLLQASVAEGTNHLAASGTQQSIEISLVTPTFAFDLSTLPAKTFGNGSFSVASYATTNSSGAVTFTNGSGSAGCSVTSAGMVTIDGAAVDPVHCVLAASLAADGSYAAAGPIEQSFNIAKAAGSVTINNIPASGAVGGNFTPTYTKAGDGTASTVSNSTSVCTVSSGVVNYIAAGTCLLQASVTAGTNHLAATGSEQSFSISLGTPTFAFDLSALTARTYGDGSFSVASHATTNSTGAVTFALGTGSVGCSVTSAGMVTIDGAAVDPVHCVLAASLAADGSYAAAGPIEQSFNIAKAGGAVSINNMPISATVGSGFTPAYTKSGDGTASVASLTTGVCTVTAGVVSFIAAGSCILQASVTEGTNHLAATGSQQSVTVVAGAGVFASACTYTINPKNDQRQVTVTWENANPGVTQIQITDGRIVTKQLAPTAAGSWRTSVKTGVPAYGLWGGSTRRDVGTNLVPAGTSCTGLN